MTPEPLEKSPAGEMKFTVEHFCKLKLDLPTILSVAYKELRLEGDPPTCDPDYAMYEMLQNSGNLLCVAARVHGQLVGYNIFILHNSFHNKQQSIAVNDVVYLLPSYRRGHNGLKLVRKTIELLTKLGVNRAFMSSVPECPETSLLLKREGWTLAQHVYSKILGA